MDVKHIYTEWQRNIFLLRLLSVTDFHPTFKQKTSSVYSTLTRGSIFLTGHHTPTFK